MKKHLRTSAAAFSILALAAVGCETDADTETGTTEEPLPEAPATEEPAS